MGANIPLPALGVQSQQQQDPLGQYGKLIALKNAMANQQQEQQLRPLQLQSAQAENQMQQQQLHDMQVGRQALQQSGGDYNKYLDSLRSGGVSPQTYMTAQKSLFDLQNSKATLDKTTLENQSKQFDQFQAHADGIQDALKKGDQNTALSLAQDGIAKAEQAGILPPGKIQPQMLLQPGALDSVKSMLGFQSQITKEALDKQETAQKAAATQTSQAELPGKQAESTTKQAQLQGFQQWQGTHPQGTYDQYQNSLAGQKAGVEAAARFPYEEKIAAVRENINNQLFNNHDAIQKVESQYLQPYQQKLQSVQELKSAVDQANAGNLAAAKGTLLKFMGVSNPDGTKRYNSAEAAQISKMGGVPQRFEGFVQNLLTGNQWTPQMADDMKSFADAQAKVANTSLNSGIDNINTLHGTHISHVNAPEGSSQSSAQPQGQPVYQGGKVIGYTTDGKTMTPAQ